MDSLTAYHAVADMFPLIEGDEFDALVADIGRNGVREPIWLHPDGSIIDGRNRHRACLALGVTVPTRMWDGAGSLVEFVLSLNLHRRHLTVGQRSGVGNRSLPMLEAEAATHVGGRPRKDKEPEADLPQVSGKKKREPQARDKAAKLVGVSGRSIGQYKRVAEQDPDLAAEVDAGHLALDRAERILRDRQAELDRIEKARQQDEHLDNGVDTTIVHGDFRQVLAGLRDVDAIITDPPYPREFIPLLADLADLADRILKPDGILAILMGQSYLPEVYRLLEGHRPYRWTACYLTPGAGYASHHRRVQSNWKPLIVYGGGPRFADVFTSKGLDADAKHHHEWGQDFQAFTQIVERLTAPGDTIVDPFAGSGTTLLAAKALGRHSTGAELDSEHYETARRRLGL